jgi:hypothetical protein
MGFLDSLLKRKKQPILDDYPVVAEVACNDGFSIVVRGYDSTMGVSGEDLFCRRYPLFLKMPEGTTPQEFTLKHGGDARAIQADGTIALINIPGEGMIMADWLHNFAEEAKKFGIELPVDALAEAMSKDMQAQGDKYWKPVAVEQKNVRQR